LSSAEVGLSWLVSNSESDYRDCGPKRQRGPDPATPGSHPRAGGCWHGQV